MKRDVEHRWLLLSSHDSPFSWLEEKDLKDLIENASDYTPVKWLGPERLTEEDDPSYWARGEQMLLRIEVVVPRSKQVVTKWELP